MTANAGKRPGDELEIALNHLQARVEAEEPPSRYDARWLLIELGSVLLREDDRATGAEADTALHALVARSRKVVQRLGVPWERAVREELQLAAAEHIHAVDPRWLSHPRYDMAYTLAARERLEARIRAAAALGTPLEPQLAEGVLRADAVLEKHRDHGQNG